MNHVPGAGFIVLLVDPHYPSSGEAFSILRLFPADFHVLDFVICRHTGAPVT